MSSQGDDTCFPGIRLTPDCYSEFHNLAKLNKGVRVLKDGSVCTTVDPIGNVNSLAYFLQKFPKKIISYNGVPLHGVDRNNGMPL